MSQPVSYNLRLEEVPALLDLCYEMRLKGYERCTPHLIGPPGIGKSTIVQEWSKGKAEELGLEWHDYDELSPQDVDRILQEPDRHFIFADKRLTNMDPTDFGIPRDVTINGKKFIRYLPIDLAILLHYCAGVLFLDEFSNESRPNMVANSYKLCRDYKMGDVSFSKSVLVVAASNSPETSEIVNRIPVPLRDRFMFIEVEPPSIEAWAEWMDKTYGPDSWDRAVLAYLKWKPSDFLANYTETSADTGWVPPATPRGWSYTALAFKMLKTDGNLRRVIAKGKLGSVGEMFCSFLENKVPEFDELVKHPEVIRGFNIEQKYLAALTIAEAIRRDEKNAKKAYPIMKYIAKIDDREMINVTFFLLPREGRTALFRAVNEDPEIRDVMAATGKALI